MALPLVAQVGQRDKAAKAVVGILSGREDELRWTVPREGGFMKPLYQEV